MEGPIAESLYDMKAIEELRAADAELTDEQKLDNAIRLAFGGDREKFIEFRDVLTVSIPEKTAAVLGGSSVTGHNYHSGAPFDADGPMTSDLDITLVGSEVIDLFTLEGFWVPGVH